MHTYTRFRCAVSAGNEMSWGSAAVAMRSAIKEAQTILLGAVCHSQYVSYEKLCTTAAGVVRNEHGDVKLMDDWRG